MHKVGSLGECGNQPSGPQLPRVTLISQTFHPPQNKLSQHFPLAAVVIKLDAFVTSESTHSELCKALKVSSFPNRKLSVIIGRLAMTCLGQARISLLLKQVHPEVCCFPSFITMFISEGGLYLLLLFCFLFGCLISSSVWFQFLFPLKMTCCSNIMCFTLSLGSPPRVAPK